MKITVALRIIGGFAVITALLFVISVSSFVGLRSIGSSNEEVNTVAVPSLTGAGDVQAQLLKISNIELETFYAQDVDAVTQARTRFEENQNQLERSFSTLNRILREAGHSTNIQEVENRATNLTRETLEVIDAQEQYLTLTASTEDLILDVEFSAGDAAMSLIDFTDQDGISRELFNQAGQLENTLNSLITLGYDFLEVEELGRAEIIRSEIQVAQETLATRFEAVRALAPNSELLGNVQRDMQSAQDSLIGSSGSLVETKERALRLRERANEIVSNNANRMDTLLQDLATLQSQVQEIADQTKTDAESVITRSSVINIILTIVSIALAAGISFLTVRAITRPLSEVNTVLDTLAGGDLTQRLDDSGQDEFGELATYVNKLIDNLRALIEGISERATQLATAAEQSSGVSAESRNAIQEQRSQVEQVATATQEMTSTSAEVARAATDALREIQHSDEEAGRVKVISDENRRTIEGLAREIQNASEVINQLSENSSNIGGILDVIRGIADQTNLLALNAAIEAARAGEQGRGFAVVADEVRTLASRTQQSTEEIQSMIESLQTDSGRAVEVMDRGRTQAETCVTQTEEAAAALQAITDSVHQASDSSTHIATAAEQQNATSQEISEKLEQIVAIAERAESGALQTDEASAEVARLSAEMQDSIRTFRL
ncbi:MULTISPECIES: methyl-accepting chemotaxis protein [Gammaproteobacteria]|uniref:methyl-accepting chemotaxis protein n=1 Tax=Gammaproteobacteria TaxID=1236 RepID=UPI000DD0980F|nr:MULTISPECIES: methyl-accepting chemotaxis protein [Gammaproteobacteria]RTE85627.1 methyl-accepting chemotaxis protein [Aliidiomarina sp. B3213]TCZ89596.1 methyl-accepting chemotaxis protein [Lysobacter sp. N42]